MGRLADLMLKSIAVFGVGPGLGQAVARRYGREGYEVVLVARGRDRLDQLAKELSAEGVTAHVVAADLERTDLVPSYAEQIRACVGDLTALYYAPAATGTGFAPAAGLRAEQVSNGMPRTVYTLVELVREFLPAMLERGDGAIVSAQGASAIRGWAEMSGWPVALAAQRHYLQSLSAEVSGKGVYVGMLYIGALIRGSAADAAFQAAEAAGEPVPDWPATDSGQLADLLWTMHAVRDRLEVVFPPELADRR
ncbi:SDR family NAD(P)-dependent oxidoreductase [Flindersiella endophytica]